MSQEFAIKLDGMHKGLRPRQYMQRNSIQTVEHLNQRVGEFGLETFEPLAEVMSGSTMYTNYGVSVNSPNPQFIKGSEVLYLADKNRLFTVDFSAGTLTEVTMYRYNSPTNPGTPQAGNSWQFIDFGDAWMLVNGTSSIFKINPQLGMPRSIGLYDRVYFANTPNINAGIQFQGRAVFGGFDSTSMSSAWRAFWQTYATKNDYGLDYDFPLTGNMVMWSTVGAMDFLWLWYPEMARNGIVTDDGYGIDNPLIFDVLRRGDSGFAPMPFQGDVLQIKQIGGNVMVYGEDGAAIMNPITDPVPTFGIKKVNIPGLMNTGAVAGDDEKHILVDKEGYVWSITADGPERLDYHEWIDDLDADDVLVSYNKVLGDFYLTDGARTFLLSPHGMTEISQVVMSTVYHNGQVYGVTL